MTWHSLKNVSLFEQLTEEELKSLAELAKREILPAHQTIFWMDEKGDRLFIIAQGKVQICYTNEEGKEITLAVLEPGSFFGEMSLIDGQPHSATARSLTHVHLLSIKSEDFYNFANQHPHVNTALLRELSKRLRANTTHMKDVINVNEQLKSKNSPLQYFIDALARGFTSGYFISFSLLFIILWMGWQIYMYKKLHHTPISFADRPPTFYILGFFITLTSFLLTVLILNSQRRQAENDRIRGEIEYQVNLKAQAEVVRLQMKMDQLIETITKLTRPTNPPPESSEKNFENS